MEVLAKVTGKLRLIDNLASVRGSKPIVEVVNLFLSIVYANQLNRCPLYVVVGRASMRRSVEEGVVPISNYLSMIIK